MPPFLPPMNPFLLAGGLLSLVAGGLHLAIIIGGPDWLRFFGAGERLAVMAENGANYPGLVTGVIAVALIIMGTYALAAAASMNGTPLPLPFVKWILLAITSVFLLRGLALVPMFFMAPQMVNGFMIWSSLIVLALGLLHAKGLVQAWSAL